MKRVVLDASALMVFFEDRSGAEVIEDLIGQAIAGKKALVMSVVNWGEVYYSTWRARGQSLAQKALAEIAQLPLEIVDADRELTRLAAEFRAQHRLPYAACFAAALARSLKASLLTQDRDFAPLGSSIQIDFL